MAKNLNSRQFLKGISGEPSSSVYLFLGEEEGEKERIISILASKFLSGDEAPSRFHLSSGELVQAAQFVALQGIFSQKRMAVIYNIEKIISKKDFALFEELMLSAEGNLIILTTPSNNPPVCMKKYPDAVPVVFWKMFENELHLFATERLRSSGKSISKDALAALTNLTGRDYNAVNEAVDKLISYCDQQQITAQMVLSVIADSKDVKIFDYISALFSGRRDSVYLLSKILDDGMHELQILAFIWKEAEKIEAYLSFVKSGVSPFDAAEKSGVPVNSREDFVKRVSSYSVEHVKNIFSMLAKADSYVKSAKNAGPLGTIMLNPLMELTEFFLCRGK